MFLRRVPALRGLWVAVSLPLRLALNPVMKPLSALTYWFLTCELDNFCGEQSVVVIPSGEQRGYISG